MASVICDTNIWYDIANGRINESQLVDLSLFGTSVNVLEISSTPNLINNLDMIVRVMKSMKKYHHLIINNNPMEHLISLFNSEYSPDCRVEDRLLSLFNTLTQIDTSIIPQKNIKSAQWQIEDMLRKQNEIAVQINSELPKFRAEIKNKLKHKRIDFSASWKKYISGLVSIYSKKYCKREYVIKVNDENWERLEFFIYTWDAYFKALEIGNRKFDKNDWGDLFNLVYVQPNFKYWTSEKKWNRIFNENDILQKYVHMNTQK